MLAVCAALVSCLRRRNCDAVGWDDPWLEGEDVAAATPGSFLHSLRRPMYSAAIVASRVSKLVSASWTMCSTRSLTSCLKRPDNVTVDNGSDSSATLRSVG